VILVTEGEPTESEAEEESLAGEKEQQLAAH
jgi:hypothetical protein